MYKNIKITHRINFITLISSVLNMHLQSFKTFLQELFYIQTNALLQRLDRFDFFFFLLLVPPHLKTVLSRQGYTLGKA